MCFNFGLGFPFSMDILLARLSVNKVIGFLNLINSNKIFLIHNNFLIYNENLHIQLQ